MPEELYTCPACLRENFTRKGLTNHRCNPIQTMTTSIVPAADQTQPVTIVAPLAPLKDCAELANQAIDAIAEKQHAFAADTLPNRCRIGLACMKANAIFAEKYGQGKAGPGRGKKNVSRRDTFSGYDSFEAWLAAEIPNLKRPLAYKYMAAARGLGLEPEAQPSAIDAKIADYQTQFGRPITLAELVSAGGAKQIGQKEPEQLPLNLVFENMRGYRLSCENLLAVKDRMDAQAHRVAVARVYATLRELTNSDWEPAETTPPEIDLDSLEGSGW